MDKVLYLYMYQFTEYLKLLC